MKVAGQSCIATNRNGGRWNMVGWTTPFTVL